MMVYYSEKAKAAYWSYFTGMTAYCPPRLTARRLSKLKKLVWEDSEFWGDLIYRHGGGNPDPHQMEPATLEHCVSNFYGMLMAEAARRGIII